MVETFTAGARETRAERGDQTLEVLRRAAAAGSAEAKAALGRRLMDQPPYDAREGLRLTMEAAEAGNGEAAHFLAVLAAAGIGLPQSWRTALSHLEQAAAMGLGLAQAELALLAGQAVPQGDAAAWERLRKSIDVRAWLATALPKPVSSSPRIGLVEGFISPALSDWLIARARPLLRPAKTDDPATGRARYEDARTNSSGEFELSQTDVVMHLLRARISALTGSPTRAMEGSVVLHYTVGQQYFPHFDFLDTSSPGYAKQVAEVGQRVLTLLIYLNDDYQGGETDFPRIRWRYKGRKGDALFFWNITASGEPDRLTEHAGLSPSSGEKWLYSQWVRGRTV